MPGLWKANKHSDSTKPISANQFVLFRVIFGAYLSWHFAALIPYGAELFSNQGVLADANLNLTSILIPDFLLKSDFPLSVLLILSSLVLLSFCLALGIRRRLCAMLIWLGWAWLFNRNNLIINPGIPYVGLLLVFCAIIPEGEFKPAWKVPQVMYSCAWFLLAAGYSYSGYYKLLSPSWQEGIALQYLLENPLARPGFFRDALLSLPSAVLNLMTWAVLFLELSFLLFSITRKTRLWSWAAMMLVHLGILLVVDFADLTLGMLMIHIFTFDRKWLQPASEGSGLFLYDSACGMCNLTIQALQREDTGKTIHFLPLQSEIGREVCKKFGYNGLGSSVYVRNPGNVDETAFSNSNAILEATIDAGGMFKLAAIFVSWVPSSVRNAVYGQIAKNRHRLWPAGNCQLQLKSAKNPTPC